MTQAQPQIPATASRLVRFLAELVDTKTTITQKHFTERLGQLFDLPDSIRISTVLGSRAEPVEQSTVSKDEVRADFLRSRTAIISSAVGSFGPGGGALRLRFPRIATRELFEEAIAGNAFGAFYSAQQSDIDFRVRNLQTLTREALAGFSPRLARLAALDASLAEPLSAHNRKLYTSVCDLLQKRIDLLRDDYRATVSGNPSDDQVWRATLARLRTEMQGLLLAEIETRMLPVLGLIEALDELKDE